MIRRAADHVPGLLATASAPPGRARCRLGRADSRACLRRSSARPAAARSAPALGARQQSDRAKPSRPPPGQWPGGSNPPRVCNRRTSPSRPSVALSGCAIQAGLAGDLPIRSQRPDVRWAGIARTMPGIGDPVDESFTIAGSRPVSGIGAHVESERLFTMQPLRERVRRERIPPSPPTHTSSVTASSAYLDECSLRPKPYTPCRWRSCAQATPVSPASMVRLRSRPRGFARDGQADSRGWLSFVRRDDRADPRGLEGRLRGADPHTCPHDLMPLPYRDPTGPG